MQRKGQVYIQNGALLAVLIDPERRLVEIYRPQEVVERLEGARSVALGAVLPGFALDVEALLG